MNLYLTSSLTGPYRSEYGDHPALDASNGFVEELRKDWTQNMTCLLISAFPDNYAINDEMGPGLEAAFRGSGFAIERFDVCDMRNQAEVLEHLNEYGLIVLGGGHVPTQNAFFEQIGLRERLAGYDGIVMGISAGSMNCAEEVYAQPELQGEAMDPTYRRFLKGLGLTRCNVIPHYQAIKDDVVDGLNVMDDIAAPDSMGRQFYVLVDGSYILRRGDEPEELHGEGYLLQDGVMTRICESGVGDDEKGMIYIGSHISSSGGYEAMGRNAIDLGADTFAFFARNPRGGSAKETPNDDDGYRQEIRLICSWMVWQDTIGETLFTQLVDSIVPAGHDSLMMRFPSWTGVQAGCEEQRAKNARCSTLFVTSRNLCYT